jgi:hypothetical protein
MKGLGQPVEPFLEHAGFRKQLFENLARVNNLNGADFGQRSLVAVRLLPPSEIATGMKPGADPERKELKPRNQEMRLDGKVLVRRLNEVPPAHAANL